MAGLLEDADTPLQDALDYVGSGAPDELVTAVNRGGDTDTIGAIAGAVAGARFGASQLPDRWLGAIDEVNELEKLATQLTDVG